MLTLLTWTPGKQSKIDRNIISHITHIISLYYANTLTKERQKEGRSICARYSIIVPQEIQV